MKLICIANFFSTVARLLRSCGCTQHFSALQRFLFDCFLFWSCSVRFHGPGKCIWCLCIWEKHIFFRVFFCRTFDIYIVYMVFDYIVPIVVIVTCIFLSLGFITLAAFTQNIWFFFSEVKQRIAHWWRLECALEQIHTPKWSDNPNLSINYVI